ncbi:uncharacterized protein HaLaN_09667 [Haematococcus lacustris]|uniref:WW domain-containing protein n=1 Tax=Haematococcus lacustris TaxID=44745 RepID=A0A699YU26_HAELA|nr:uncharacterized protein HaLaN_09667 [Haematococcus lacustris]
MSSRSIRVLSLVLLWCTLVFVADAAKTKSLGGKPTTSNRLIDLIGKRETTASAGLQKAWDDFTAELAAGADVNQPDTRGRLPLIEAVRSKDVKYVDALIQFGARANSKDPATGVPPVLLAFSTGQTEVARLLLAYGADIDMLDKSGKSARELQGSEDIAALVKLYDANDAHALAFEDAPASWVKKSDEKGNPYWWNSARKEARWNIPPSCAWQRTQYQGQPAKYTNYVTGQTTAKLPPALSWRLLRQADQDVWYNWATNTSQSIIPDELPADMLEEVGVVGCSPLFKLWATEMRNVRWWNPKTQQYSWEDPRFLTPWRAVKAEDSDKTYFVNIATGESTWEAPEEMAWQELESKEHAGQKYWYNARTGESTWDMPTHHSWERHTSDL